MQPKLTINIETARESRSSPPWVALSRRGRQSSETQCFALLGYSETDFHKLEASALENAKDKLSNAIRLFSAFEYIPDKAAELEIFFEKKLVNFENRVQGAKNDIPPLQAAIGVVQNGKILFASSGDILILQITPVSIVNLGEAIHSGPTHFDTFRTGSLAQNSCLLFIPKTIGAILKSEELKNIHLARRSERKLDYLEHLWQKRLGAQGQFRAILLTAQPKIVKDAESTAVSIAHLLNTEAKTEDLLSPPLLRPLLERLQSSVGLFLRKTKALIFKFRGHSIKIPTLSSALIRATQKSKEIPRAWLYAVKPKHKNAIDLFNSLPHRSKILLILVATFVFIFAQSALFANRQNGLNKTNEIIRAETAAIQELIDSANAALIYNDEDTAKSQISQAQDLLNKWKTPPLSLQNGISQVKEKLRRVVNIENPAPVEKGSFPFFAQKRGTTPTAMYNKHIYELRPGENQIFKDGAKWIKDGTDVSKGTGLAVDGLIYVIEDTGKITEFRKGHKTVFALKDIDPPLLSAVKIWTDENSDYLYILDPQEKRLIVFAKTNGALSAQYTSPTFAELNDFSVNEKTKTAYLLNGANVVSVPLSHL